MNKHPDILRRFVPAPYVFNVVVGYKDIRIESSHLDIAFGLRRYVSDQEKCDTPVLHWRVIRDESTRYELEEVLIYDSGSLRTLFWGPGTILIHDPQRSELFGFLAAGVEIRKVIDCALPLLIEKT